MVGLNYLLGGGFENARVYGFFGLQGEGKSLTLLNLALQLKKYNKTIKPKTLLRNQRLYILHLKIQREKLLLVFVLW